METEKIPLPGKETGILRLGNGVSCQWIEGGKVLHLRLDNVSRSAIDTMISALDDYFYMIPDTYYSRVLYEIGGVPLTPYLRRRTEEIARNHLNQEGKGAVLLRPTTFTLLIQRFVEWELQRTPRRSRRRIFTSREAALEWLLDEP